MYLYVSVLLVLRDVHETKQPRRKDSKKTLAIHRPEVKRWLPCADP
jgi:hypothetical protein